MNKNVIVGQSGGPTSVINSSLAGVISAAKKNGIDKVFGMKYGIKGFLRDSYVDLLEKVSGQEEIELLKRTPASYLGSCRFKLPEISEDKEIYEKIFSKLKALNIGYFFYIGGNDSMDTIKKLSDYAAIVKSDIKFMGIPKTIDNDLAMTDHTPGFGSAAKYIATAIKEIVCDCRVYDVEAVTIVEIMGRNAGWLTASAALARGKDCEGADMIFLPEKPFDLEHFFERIKELVAKKKYVVVALSEGVKLADGRFVCELGESTAALDAFGHKMMSGSAKYLENRIKSELGIKARSIEISTLQRCSSHFASMTDVQEAFDVGVAAVNAAIKNETGKVICIQRISNEPYTCIYEANDVHEIANVEKKVPLSWITDDNQLSCEALDYIRPLVQGEVLPFIVDGLPLHLKLD